MKQSEINRLYKEKMISGGYCPKCGDFLIPRKKTTRIKGVGGYKGGVDFATGVSLECINPQCDYTIDLGDDAQVTERKTEADNPNSISGKVYPKNEVYHRNAFGSKDIVMCSGKIKNSLLPSVKKSSIIGIHQMGEGGKVVIVEYFDEKMELRREFIENIRIIDE